MIRKATISDAKQIHALIAAWAKKGKVLDRSLNYIYENIRDFWVYENRRKIIGCCALHVIGWKQMGEVKSLLVSKQSQKKGLGKALVKQCLTEAKTIGIREVFALTFSPGFFKKLGFKRISMKKLPHKIWGECINCASFPDCKEIALLKKL